MNLIGEHTDYNQGLALPFAIDRHVTVRFTPDGGSSLRLVSADHGSVTVELGSLLPGMVGWATYVAGAAWALQSNDFPVSGGTVEIASDLPAGAGLSSSAALCAASVLALAGQPIEPMELALLAHAAEAGFAQVPCGLLDQIAVCCAMPGHAVLVDARSQTASPVALDLADQGLELLLIDTGVRHFVNDGAYAERRSWCVQAVAQLGVSDLSAVTDPETDLEPPLAGVVRHVVTENARVRSVVELLKTDPRAIGPLLTESHRSLQHDYLVSCPELDSAVDDAIAAGALGARMTGAGFGGSAIALVEAESCLSVAEQLRAACADRQTSALGVAVGGARLAPNLFG